MCDQHREGPSRNHEASFRLLLEFKEHSHIQCLTTEEFMSVRYPLHLHLLSPKSHPTTATVVSVHLAQCFFRWKNICQPRSLLQNASLWLNLTFISYEFFAESDSILYHILI